jgi:hypothetical protein
MNRKLLLLCLVLGVILCIAARCSGDTINDIQAKRAISAANMSVLIYLCTLVSTVLIVERCVLACAAYALGGWVGTYVAVKRKK